MDWINIVQQSLNYIEDHVLEELDAEVLSSYVSTSNAYFQKIFHIVTGFTIGEYIRNCRLSLAGEEIAGGKVKVLDATLKYGYESPESFTKAFLKFHGMTPSAVRKQGCHLNYFYPLQIQIHIDGGFVMSRKLIPNVEKLYETKSENYMFPSCMRSAMSALNEDEAYDFSFFAGVCGDLFTQIWLEPKWRYTDSYSNVCKDTQLPLRYAFNACGYEYSYVTKEELQTDQQRYLQKIVASIDKGMPVLAFGIVGPPVCSIVCGYGNEGELLIGWSQFSGEQQEDEIFDHEFSEHYFQVRNGLDHCDALIFFGRKKEKKSMKEAMITSIQRIPKMASLPSTDEVYFGRNAFEAWADSLLEEESFLSEEQLEGPLDTYLSCVVLTGTSLFYIDDYLLRTKEICVKYARQIDDLRSLFQEEKRVFDEMIEFQGGYFFEKDRKALQNKDFRMELSKRIRAVGVCYEKACSFNLDA